MSLSQDMMEDAFSPAKGIEAVYVRNLSDYLLRCHGSRQKLTEPLSPNKFEGGLIIALQG